MPLEIWSHFIHPLTHNGVDGNSQDFSPDDITRVKRIASGSIVLGAVEAYSSSRSVKFSIITIGLATLVIFYIAAAIFKMRIRENPNPKQSDSSNPAPLEPNPNKEQETNLEQQKKEEREDAPIVETSSAQETSPPAALSPQPMIPSGPQASPPIDEKPKESIPSAQGLPQPQVSSFQPIIPSSYQAPSSIPEERKEPIPSAQGLTPLPLPSPQQVISSGPESPTSTDSPTLEKSKEIHRTEVAKEQPRGADQTSTGKGLEKETEKSRAKKLPASEPRSPAQPSPQLAVRSDPPQVNLGKGTGKKEKKLENQRPSSIASPQPSVPITKQKTYSDLQLTVQEAKKIGQIIKTLGNTWLAFLATKQDELTALGKDVEHVHPLKFLETVLKNSELKNCMISIKSSDTKWEGFLKGEVDGVLKLLSKAKEVPGFIEKCNRENDQNNFAIYIDDFCRVVKARVDKVRPFVENKDWAGLVQFLLKPT